MTVPITPRYQSTQRDLKDALIAAGETNSKRKKGWPFVMASIATAVACIFGGKNPFIPPLAKRFVAIITVKPARQSFAPGAPGPTRTQSTWAKQQ